jgi:hypothetical protein
MMKRSTLLIAAAALVAMPAVAKADSTRQMCEYSGTDLTCVRAKFVLSGANLQVYLFNGVGAASLNNSSIQGFGVYNLGAYGGTWGLSSVIYQNSGVSTNVSGDWDFATSFPSLSVTLNAGADADGNGGLSTCTGPLSGGSGPIYVTCDGFANPTFTGNQDWVMFTFTHTGGTALNEAAISTLEWGFRSQRVGTNQNNSGQCSSAIGSADYCGPGDDPPGGGQGDGDVVPEPATMTLLATGLAGMAAARRRKKTV